MEPFRFTITDEIRVVIERLRIEKKENYEFGKNWWLTLTYGPVISYLAQDGRVFYYMEGDPDEEVTEAEANSFVSWAIKYRDMPELPHLLPPRPSTALDCIACGGDGNGAIGTFGTCGDCHGLGWIRVAEDGGE